MSKKRGLGKGLKALIPPITGEDFNKQDAIKEIPLDDILPGTGQARSFFDEEKLNELAESIKEFGIIQPVVVRPSKDGRFELIAGERRWRACREAGLKTIPALVKDYRDEDAVAVSLVENIQRAELSPLEEAAAYKKLTDEFGMTQEEVAARVGKSRSLVANTIRLLDLPESIKTMLYSGDLTAGHARAILALPDEQKRIYVAEKAKTQKMNVRQTETAVKKLQEEGKQKKGGTPPERKSVPVAEIAARIGRTLGCRTTIREKKGGGFVVELELNSESDLIRLIDTISLTKH